MPNYVQLGDVRTWYDEYGDGEPLVLLHPGGADARAWARLVLIRGVFHRDGWIPAAIDPNRDRHEAIARAYAELSPDGPEHFPTVAAKLNRMDFEEPTLTVSDLAGVASRTLVMVADDDEVTLEHAVEMYRGLPTAELAIIPGTSHGAAAREARDLQRGDRRVPRARSRIHDRARPPLKHHLAGRRGLGRSFRRGLIGCG